MQTHSNLTALWSIINEQTPHPPPIPLFSHSPPPHFFYYVQLQLTGSPFWPITALSCNSQTLELSKQVHLNEQKCHMHTHMSAPTHYYHVGNTLLPHWEDWTSNEIDWKLRHMLREGKSHWALVISDPIIFQWNQHFLLQINEMLQRAWFSLFMDTYFILSCGSCKLECTFLWGPVGERVLMNVLVVGWKLLPSRRQYLRSCNLTCLVDWWWKKERKKRKKWANQRKKHIEDGPLGLYC